jgi:ornithine--oxo-acid transaminase
MAYTFSQLIKTHQKEQFKLHDRYVSPANVRVNEIIGFDKMYVRGAGAYLWDIKGVKYLDLLAGYGVFNIGRSHPKIKKLLHEFIDLDRPNMVKMDNPLLAGLLAEELVKRVPAGLDAVFFVNSGAEAVETALKFARSATKRPRILYVDHAFHGLTFGALSINGGEYFRRGFEPLMPECTKIPFNDLEALEKELRKRNVAAFIVEPIQGKGVYMPDDDYLPGAQALCRKYGTVFICDEVQAGMGRTGKFVSCQHWNVEPDMITIAKSLSGGYVPVSACLMRRPLHDKVMGGLERSAIHSSTFSQNDMAMAAGLATLHVLDEERIIENAARVGTQLIEALSRLKEKHDMLIDVRGKGMMVGIEFGPPKSLKLRAAWTAIETAKKGLVTQLIVMALLKYHHILTQVGGPGVNINKLLPPLIIGEPEMKMIVNAFDEVLTDLQKFPGRVWGLSTELVKESLRS